VVLLNQVSNASTMRGCCQTTRVWVTSDTTGGQVQHHRTAVDPTYAIAMVQQGLELQQPGHRLAVQVLGRQPPIAN